LQHNQALAAFQAARIALPHQMPWRTARRPVSSSASLYFPNEHPLTATLLAFTTFLSVCCPL
jgi:hypothetical protein